jgi:hypothetical protein
MTGLRLDVVIIACAFVICFTVLWATDKVIRSLGARVGNLELQLGRELEETRRELRRITSILNRAHPLADDNWEPL